MTMNDAPKAGESVDAEVAAVTRTVEDYFLGWYDADQERVRRALHPDLAKRAHILDGDGPPTIRAVTATQMIRWTGDGQGRRTEPAERCLKIVVDEIHGSIATARVDSVPYREYLHLARTPEGWRIVNALWTWTDGYDRRD